MNSSERRNYWGSGRYYREGPIWGNVLAMLFVALLFIGGVIYAKHELSAQRQEAETRMANEEREPSSDSLLITGDSHVAYAQWSTLLPDLPVRAVGVPGHPIEGTLLALPKYLTPNTKRIIVWVGVNNLLLFYRKNNEVLNSYSELLTYLREKELVFSIMAIIPLANMPKFNEQIKDINPQLRALTLAYGGRYIDPTAELAPKGVLDSSYTTDGIHLNEKGYAIIAKHIKAAASGAAGL